MEMPKSMSITAASIGFRYPKIHKIGHLPYRGCPNALRLFLCCFARHGVLSFIKDWLYDKECSRFTRLYGHTVMPYTTQPLRVLVVKKLGIVSAYNIVAAFQSNDPKGIALQGGVCDALTGEPVCFAPFIIVIWDFPVGRRFEIQDNYLASVEPFV